ncbi:hypothetical protein [Stenotrophomonas maltophilia]|uniref:hypothetical protein n=1 Tax=Stenotrophomonas maltophilia TaxID=40324 RepID=UPI000C26424B|nr:hypothetical protein [Stenotrophomonas maltophilia]PJL60637.1 hypothetical protein B9Y82_18645 [Stenotrophomonas maltophilia]
MKKTKTLAPRLNPQRAPRERRMDHNTVSRPKRAKARVLADGPAETVEQFEARGGQVQRLTASWEQRA